MKRTSVGLLVVSLAVAIAAPAAAAPAKANSIAGVMGNLRWGMNERDVKTALRPRIKDKSALSALESSYVEFTGSTRWDRTPVAEEYTSGNEESMLGYKDADGSENYYFFIGGQLWKWVKYYPASAFGGSDFEKFSSRSKPVSVRASAKRPRSTRARATATRCSSISTAAPVCARWTRPRPAASTR